MGARSSLYNSRAWKAARAAFLRENPVCRFCGKPLRGADAIVDHIIPHKGDLRLFWDPQNWQPLCKRCHDIHKQKLERGGTVSGCDERGFPLDASHPWNAEHGQDGN